MAAAILIPWRSDDPTRITIRAIQDRWLAKHYPDVEIILADDGAASGPFNRCKALNRARARTTAQWLFTLDADCLPKATDLATSIDAAQTSGWVTCYEANMYIPLHRVLQGGDPWTITGTVRGAANGVKVIHADVWDNVGGWDEGFVGWGFEDTAFTDLLTRTHPPAVHPPCPRLITIDHPRPDQMSDEVQANRRHYQRHYVDGKEQA